MVWKEHVEDWAIIYIAVLQMFQFLLDFTKNCRIWLSEF